MDLLTDILHLPVAASSVANAIDTLHFVIISVTMLGAIGIFGTAIYFIVRFRRRPSESPTPKVVAKPWVEALFIGAPLAFFLALFVVGFNLFVKVKSPPSGAMDVWVTSKQWMWQFTYPEGPSSINVLRVPLGRDVRLLLTSRDVIHSFYVPAFRLKQDAVPGRFTEIWFRAVVPGTFPLRCAEYCGLSHSAMVGEVVVLDPKEYASWLNAQRDIPSRADAPVSKREPARFSSSLVRQGEIVAARLGCLRCHSIDGSPHIAPTWLDLYGRRETLSDGSTVVADDAYLTESMMRPGAKIVAGYQNIMPSFQGKMDPGEAAALIEFIKSLRSKGPGRAITEAPAFEPAR